MVFRNRLIVGILAMLWSAAPLATTKGAEFSATAVQITPQGTMESRIYIGNGAMRKEYHQDKQAMVEILHQDGQRRLLLFPDKKTYFEQQTARYPDQRIADKDSPCTDLPGTVCRKLADETINGMQTEKWEFSRVLQGRPVHTLHWIEVQRNLPIKEFFHDGTVVEMDMQENEQLNGRNAEKWRMNILHADGRRMQSLQWYDPELKQVIREEHPGGYVRELRDIKQATQPANLFMVPKGYSRQAPPVTSGVKR